MTLPILSVAIRTEQDTVAARQRCREIARMLGFDNQDQTRLATAISEIARNAFRYAGGGRAEFIIEGETPPQLLIIRLSDKGPGIADLDSVLEGRYVSKTGMGMGITAVRRLLDQFDIVTRPGVGTTVTLKKFLPRRAPRVTAASLPKLVEELGAQKPADTFAEMEQQNQELLRTLEELRKRQKELLQLNQELQDTNRGVVALYAELDEKADHLRRADSLKTKFLSNMSHEFRSPLNSILALSGLLLGHTDGPLTADQTQQVLFIKKAADDLYELVNDLLDLAKVEAGRVEVKPVDFEVANLFGALRGMLRPLFVNESVALVFEAAEEFPAMHSDEGKISQVLRNFISNALKFTEHGEVRVGAVVDGDRVRFRVRDTGIGIAQANHERIFEEFAQVDNPMQHRSKGTGLGLPLCRQLAKLLQGSVWLESELGRGSTFYLETPLRFVSEQAMPPPVVLEVEEEGVPVLIVENRQDTILMYSKWLRASGLRMASATNTRDAMEHIAAQRPTAVVLDILLDGEDSWDFLATLKQDPGTRDIPVLVVSTVEDPGKAYHLGADGYIVKPVSRERFLATLLRLTTPALPPRILIIDDNEKDRYILKHRLRGTRVQIDEASSGAEGIARAIAGRPDLIFLDIAMPGMNGFDVLDALKADSRTRSIEVIVQTSLILDKSGYQRLAGRVAAIVTKDGRDLSPGVDAIIARLHRPTRPPQEHIS